MSASPTLAFFGGEPLGLPALEALIQAGLVPSLVYCNPDRPKGRGQTLQAPAIKEFALSNNLLVKQPTSFSNQADFPELTGQQWDIFVVVAYNFILPSWFLQLPKHGVINVHPSLLPKLRGASPIRTAILEDLPEQVGISIMLLDEKMDHGPLLTQKAITPPVWPISGPELDVFLGHSGGALLATTIKSYLDGNITPTEQAHEGATYTRKLTKEAGELFINPFALPEGEEAQTLLRKIHAFAGNPGTYFFYHGKRIKILSAQVNKAGVLCLDQVVPEGKSPQPFTQYLQSLTN